MGRQSFVFSSMKEFLGVISESGLEMVSACKQPSFQCFLKTALIQAQDVGTVICLYKQSLILPHLQFKIFVIQALSDFFFFKGKFPGGCQEKVIKPSSLEDYYEMMIGSWNLKKRFIFHWQEQWKVNSLYSNTAEKVGFIQHSFLGSPRIHITYLSFILSLLDVVFHLFQRSWVALSILLLHNSVLFSDSSKGLLLLVGILVS